MFGAGCGRPAANMNPMSTNRVLRALGIVGICFALSGSIAGSQGLGLDVSPLKFELAIPPGTSQYSIPITIRNSSPAQVHIVSAMVDFGLKNNGDYVFQPPGTRPYSLMKWASINPQQFDLAPGTTQQVRLTLTIPRTDLSGEYAGMVWFATRPTRAAHAIAISVRIATKIYATIPGTVKSDGAIAKMTAANGAGGEHYRVTYRNLGNVHQYINGQVLVRRGDQQIQAIEMPKEMLVERGGERVIDVDGGALPPGKYQVIAIVDYGGKTETGGQIMFDKQ
jgi:P pilus assembly chaperone PapD